MEVIVEVMDQNDNRPEFTQNPFLGSVPEASKLGNLFKTNDLIYCYAVCTIHVFIVMLCF